MRIFLNFCAGSKVVSYIFDSLKMTYCAPLVNVISLTLLHGVSFLNKYRGARSQFTILSVVLLLT